jgi:hypothetical protein
VSLDALGTDVLCTFFVITASQHGFVTELVKVSVFVLFKGDIHESPHSWVLLGFDQVLPLDFSARIPSVRAAITKTATTSHGTRALRSSRKAISPARTGGARMQIAR